MTDAAIPQIDTEAQADLRDALGDEDFDRLVGIFRETLPTRLAEINAAHQAGDANMVARASHALKGASANLGFVGLAKLFSNLEMTGKAGDLGPVGDLYAQAVQGSRATFPDIAL